MLLSCIATASHRCSALYSSPALGPDALFLLTSSSSLLSLHSITVPRATSERFGHSHAPAAASSVKKDRESTSGKGALNPIFNTAQFGQHILKNPL
jgi:hypothetical protein